MAKCYLCNKQLSLHFQRFEQLDGDSRIICSECFNKLYIVDFSHDYYIHYSSEPNFMKIYIKGILLDFLKLFSYKDLKNFQKRKINKIKFDVTYLYSFRIGV